MERVCVCVCICVMSESRKASWDDDDGSCCVCELLKKLFLTLVCSSSIYNVIPVSIIMFYKLWNSWRPWTCIRAYIHPIYDEQLSSLVVCQSHGYKGSGHICSVEVARLSEVLTVLTKLLSRLQLQKDYLHKHRPGHVILSNSFT